MMRFIWALGLVLFLAACGGGGVTAGRAAQPSIPARPNP